MENSKLIIIDNLFSKSTRVIDPKRLCYNEWLSKIVKNKRIYCISRDSNFDGLCGPVFLIKDYNLKMEDTFFIQQTEFDSFFKEFKKLKPKNSMIIISDLNLNEKNFDDVKKMLSYLKSKNNVVLWTDHHLINQKQIKLLEEYISFGVQGENYLYCASELLYTLLCREDKYSKELAQIVHINDFALNSTKYKKIEDKLSYGIVSFSWNSKTKQRNLRKLSGLIASGKLNSKFLNVAYNNYIKSELKSKKMLMKSATIIHAKHKIGVGFSKRLQTNAACAEIMKKFKTEISIYLNTETGKGGIRSIYGVDCSYLANGFGGGGHPQASGFNLDSNKYYNFNRKGLDKFMGELEKITGKRKQNLKER